MCGGCVILETKPTVAEIQGSRICLNIKRVERMFSIISESPSLFDGRVPFMANSAGCNCVRDLGGFVQPAHRPKLPMQDVVTPSVTRAQVGTGSKCVDILMLLLESLDIMVC